MFYKQLHKYNVFFILLLATLSISTWAQEWQVVEENPGWHPRKYFSVSIFKEKLYLFGGLYDPTFYSYDDAIYYNDIWISEDGSSWSLLLEDAPWQPRVGRFSIAYKGKLFIGGSSNVNDALWYTSDGVTWAQHGDVPWTSSPRFYIFEDLLYAVGSAGIWSSSDGFAWNSMGEVSIALPTQGVEVHNGSAYYYYATNLLPWHVELLRTENAVEWESVAFGDHHTDLVFRQIFRPEATLTSYAGYLWLCAGTRYDDKSNFWPYDEVHRSVDGTEWERMEDLPDRRAGDKAVVFDNKLWLFGGVRYNGPPRNSIIYLEIESSEGDSQEGEAPIEGQLEGEGFIEEGEGSEPLSLPERLLADFPTLSGNGASLPFTAAQAQVPELTQEAFDALDSDGNGALQVSELLEALGGVGAVHRADLNGNGGFELSETLRFIQAYNSQGYHCAANAGAAEDGFDLGVDATQQACVPHVGDYDPQDWAISLSELLRLVQLYNADGYTPCPTGEDGFCPAGE